MTKRRVVITGMGAVTPVGNSVPELWKSIRNGACGIGPITLFDASSSPVKIAAEIKNFAPEEHGIDPKEARRMARFTQFLLAAANEAVADAKLSKEELAGDRTGIVAGNGLSGMDVIDASFSKYVESGKRRASPLAMPELIPNEAAANVSIALGISGSAWTIATACASGTDALGLALDTIRSGRLDVCLAGGSESGITEFSIKSFAGMHALTDKFNDSPEKASRPFDRDRSGFVMGEGGAILISRNLNMRRLAERISMRNSPVTEPLRMPTTLRVRAQTEKHVPRLCFERLPMRKFLRRQSTITTRMVFPPA